MSSDADTTLPAPRIQLTPQEWKAKLNPEEYAVLRQAATERPFTGEYTDTKTEGVYVCRACGAELFRSTEKFDSHCGWPSFFDPAESEAVILRSDDTLGMRRVEVLCANCHSHLGHVFEGEGYNTPTDKRYCINSIALQLHPRAPQRSSLRRSAERYGSRSRCACPEILGHAVCRVSGHVDPVGSRNTALWPASVVTAGGEAPMSPPKTARLRAARR